MVSLISDLPNQNANQITIRVFMNYSKIQFRMPLLPCIMSSPEDITKQILQYSATFVGTMNPTKATWVWLPGAGRVEDEDDDTYIARKTLEIEDGPAYIAGTDGTP